MKHFILLSTILFSISVVSQNTWTLEECIEHAKINNIDVLKQKFNNKSLNEDITIAKGNYYPDATFNASQGFSLGNSFNVSTGVGQLESRFNSFSLSSSINLFNGFSNRNKLQLAKLNTQKGDVDLDQIKLDLSLNITNKYLLVLFNKEILSVAKEQELISQQEVNRLTKLYKAALKSKSELLEMESTLALDKKEHIIAANNVTNSLIELQALLDIKIIENFDIKTINIDDVNGQIVFSDSHDIYGEALKTNPLLISTQLKSDMNEKDIQIAMANLYPRLNFNYSYGSNYYHIQGREDIVFNQETNQYEDNGFLIQLDNNRTHYLGFSLTVPIFNRFQTRSNIDKTKIELEINQVELENQKKELKHKIEIAWNDVIAAKSSLEASSIALTSQQEAFTIAQKKYLEGYMTNYEFLVSKTKYIKTQSDLITAKYEYMFKIKVLEYYK